jgi:BTB/POZ domain
MSWRHSSLGTRPPNPWLFSAEADFKCRLLRNANFSDFTIKCRQYTFRVHKVVLCNFSGYFDRLCNGAFREATVNEVDLSEDFLELIARLLLMMYTGKCDDRDNFREFLTSSAEAGTELQDAFAKESACVLHAHLYALGDRLLVPALKTMAAGLFASSIKKPDRRMSELTTAIRTVYNLTADGENELQKIVVYGAQQGGAEVRRDPRYKALVRTCPAFAADMLLKCDKKDPVWCRRYERHVPLMACKCGWSGQCKRCIQLHLDVSRLSCSRYGRKITIQLEAPAGGNGKRRRMMKEAQRARRSTGSGPGEASGSR